MCKDCGCNSQADDQPMSPTQEPVTPEEGTGEIPAETPTEIPAEPVGGAEEEPKDDEIA